jgi:hypothetical protein
MATARGRLEVCHERFEALPDQSGVAELLLTRMEWFVAHGEAAWSRALGDRPRRPSPSPRPRTTASAVVRWSTARSSHWPGASVWRINRERLASCLRARALRGGAGHVVPLFDVLAATCAR